MSDLSHGIFNQKLAGVQIVPSPSDSVTDSQGAPGPDTLTIIGTKTVTISQLSFLGYNQTISFRVYKQQTEHKSFLPIFLVYARIDLSIRP